MTRPSQDDVQGLRERLGLRIDVAAKAVTEVLHAAADLFIATSSPQADTDLGSGNANRTDSRKGEAVPQMLPPKQAAAYLGVKDQTLAIWRSTGRYAIPFVKVGRIVYYRKTDLDAFLQRRTVKSGGEDDSG